MQVNSTIHFLNNQEIDKQKWDECISSSSSASIYARSFYLDNMCPGWKGLIGENYGWVLPVTGRKKWGINYLYQPAFTQQSGLFAKHGVDVPYEAVLTILQKHYLYWEINWNNRGFPQISNHLLHIDAATNFILNLKSNYDSITQSYHQDLIRNLKKAEKYKHSYRPTDNFIEHIRLYKKHYEERMPDVKADDYNNFINMCNYASENKMLICRESIDESGQLSATALLLFDGKRLYNMMNTTTDAGRKTGGNHFLLDAVIKEFSGQNLLFDFEGSDLPGVKEFYQNFGAVDEGYFKLKYNNLPWPLKLFKK